MAADRVSRIAVGVQRDAIAGDRCIGSITRHCPAQANAVRYRIPLNGKDPHTRRVAQSSTSNRPMLCSVWRQEAVSVDNPRKSSHVYR
jgi:hypothetical protein